MIWFNKTWTAILFGLLFVSFGSILWIGRQYYGFCYFSVNSKHDAPKNGQSIRLLIPKGNAIPPSEDENDNKAPCSFDIGGWTCELEADMHRLVRDFLPRNSVVMEMGARYGSTSCLIAHLQENSGRLLAIEPDIRAIPALIGNQASHFCNFHIIAGAVSEKPMYLEEPLDMATLISPIKGTEPSNITRVPNFSWESVEQILGLKVDTLVVDCEGCEKSFFEEYFEKKHSQLKAILVEWHEHLPIDLLNQWLEKFERVGFTVVDNKKFLHSYVAIIKT